jgi:hypothetical protein
VLLLKGAMDLDWEDAVAELDQSWATVRSTFEQAEARL